MDEWEELRHNGGMQSIRLKLLEAKEIATGTMAFYFEKPRDFTYKAGQYFDIALIDPVEMDSNGPVRTFSIASAPHEPLLMIATRIRESAFKRSLRSFPINSEVEVRGKGGTFTLHTNEARAAVFFAGGMGITAFRSMIVDAVARGTKHRIILFYSNKDRESAAFLDEMNTIAARNETITVIYTPERISTSLIEEQVKNIPRPLYYIAGPMEMVEATRKLLEKLGVDDDDVRGEDFPGY